LSDCNIKPLTDVKHSGFEKPSDKMAKEAMELTSTGNGATNGLSANLDATKPNVADLVKTPHNTRLFQANQVLKKQLDDLIEYEIAHPRNPRPVTPEEINSDKQISGEITARERRIRTQLSLVKSLYRKSVLKVREEKAETADDRAVNDALILGLHNLKYEEQSLRSEIAAAENYE
jgi:THO complex subunit 5